MMILEGEDRTGERDAADHRRQVSERHAIEDVASLDAMESI